VLCHQPVIEGVARSAAPQFIELIGKLANHFFPVRLFVDEHDASADCSSMNMTRPPWSGRTGSDSRWCAIEIRMRRCHERCLTENRMAGVKSYQAYKSISLLGERAAMSDNNLLTGIQLKAGMLMTKTADEHVTNALRQISAIAEEAPSYSAMLDDSVTRPGRREVPFLGSSTLGKVLTV
jgi:hypothetical protein